MEDREKPPLLVRYASVTFFIVLAMGTFTWFCLTATDVVQQVFAKSDSVTFDKGVFYLLGAAIGSALLSAGGVYEGILGNVLTDRLTGFFTKAMIGAVALAFILPHVVHYALDNYLIDQGYEVCPEVSSQWLQVRTIVFVTNRDVCLVLEQEEELRLK